MPFDWEAFSLGALVGFAAAMLLAAFCDVLARWLSRAWAWQHRARARRRNAPLPTIEPWKPVRRR